jgi:hypothetical protein
MKKVGLIIFGLALFVGVVFANIFSFGRLSDRVFNFSINMCGTKGSGHVVSESRDLSGFSGIDVGGIYKVDVTAQKDFAVQIEADDNLMPLIRTEVDGDVLRIESDKRMSPSSPILIHVYAPDISSLEVSGAASVDARDLDNSDLSIDSSGAAKIKVAGSTAKLTLDVSGGTGVDAQSLKAEDATVQASGASNVIVNVSGDLDTDASGASKIIYTGTPANIKKNTSGAATVRQK